MLEAATLRSCHVYDKASDSRIHSPDIESITRSFGCLWPTCYKVAKAENSPRADAINYTRRVYTNTK